MNKNHPDFIYVGDSCNNKCIFCTESEITFNKTFKEVCSEISSAKREINIMGKEPTLRKDIFDIIKFAKLKGKYVAVTTNARMLSYPGFCKKFKDSGIDEFGVSIHGPEKIHDFLTQTPGSYNQTMNGLKNIAKFKIPFMVNIVAVKQNRDILEEFVGIIQDLKPVNINILFCIPTSLDKKTIPKMTEILSVVKKIIDKYDNVGTVGYPLCLMKGYESVAGLCTESSHVTKFLEKCSSCSHGCGVYVDYINLYGDDEFK